MKRPVPEPFFNKVAGVAWNSINKETLAQVFSCEFCEIFKNTYFTEHLRTTAFVHNHTKINTYQVPNILKWCRRRYQNKTIFFINY